MDKGTVLNTSMTKAACRRKPGIAENPQPDKFKVKYKYLKGLVFDCLDGSNTDNYSMPMKEVANYICRKFDYSTDIQR